MLPYLGRPIVEHCIARAAGLDDVEEIVLVVGHEAESVMAHFGSHYAGTPITYHHQEVQRGLIDALTCAAPSVRDAPFLLLLGDEVMVEPRLAELLAQRERFDAVLGAVPDQPSECVRKTYTFLCGPGGLVHRLIEKPRVPLNDLMGTGVVVFPEDTYEVIERTPISPQRQERDLPGVLQTMIDEGRRVGWFPVCRDYVNVNHFTDLSQLDSDPFRLPTHRGVSSCS